VRAYAAVDDDNIRTRRHADYRPLGRAMAEGTELLAADSYDHKPREVGGGRGEDVGALLSH
jgi:hypothetical protein